MSDRTIGILLLILAVALAIYAFFFGVPGYRSGLLAAAGVVAVLGTLYVT